MSSIRNVPIPTDLALRLCSEIRKKQNQQWDTASARWCWYCSNKTPTKPESFGFSKQEGNLGCPLVNALFVQRFEAV